MNFEREQIVENLGDLKELSKPGNKPWTTEKSDPATAANGMSFEGGPEQSEENPKGHDSFPLIDRSNDGYGGYEPKFDRPR